MNKYFKQAILIPLLYSGWSSKAPSFIRAKTQKIEILLQLRAIQFAENFKAEDWAIFQSNKIEQLLKHAWVSVPFWQKVFSEFNITSINKGTLEKLPLTNRVLLKSYPANFFLSKAFTPDEQLEAATSGSTSEPMRFFYERASLKLIGKIDLHTQFAFAGFPLMPPILMLGLPTHIWMNDLGLRCNGPDLEDANKRRGIIYHFLQKVKPSILIGTPSLLIRFRELMIQDNFHFDFKAIKYVGEVMSEPDKERLSDFFSAHIFSPYATRETLTIATQCKFNKFHELPWRNLIEITDAKGNRLPMGTKGKILITCFSNFVMPFIRYEVGDEGSLTEEICLCGRMTKIIEFKGREAGMIKIPNGPTIQTLSITSRIAKEFPDQIARFQLEQRNTEFIFRFIPGPLYSKETDQSIRNFLNNLFETKMELILEKVETMPINEHGKVPLFIKRV